MKLQQTIKYNFQEQNIKINYQNMLRVNSEVFRSNNHSLNKKSSPLSLQTSKAQSLPKNRKMSMTSIKETIPDLQKLIMDIKISPNPQNSDLDCIKKIKACLIQLRKNPNISQEVNTVAMMMETVERKLVNPPYNNVPRVALESSSKRNSLAATTAKLNQISPIKQMGDQASSRIVYTNFSLKDIEKSATAQKENTSQQNSYQKSGSKVVVSKFEDTSSEFHNNSDVERLNDEIKYLQDLLHKKTGGGKGLQGIFKKKSNKY